MPDFLDGRSILRRQRAVGLKRLNEPGTIVESQVIRIILLARERDALSRECCAECSAAFVVQHALKSNKTASITVARGLGLVGADGMAHGRAMPAALRPAPICIWQPGLPVATAEAPPPQPLDLRRQHGPRHPAAKREQPRAAAALGGAGNGTSSSRESRRTT
jgi:hypothetical protein